MLTLEARLMNKMEDLENYTKDNVPLFVKDEVDKILRERWDKIKAKLQNSLWKEDLGYSLRNDVHKLKKTVTKKDNKGCFKTGGGSCTCCVNLWDRVNKLCLANMELEQLTNVQTTQIEEMLEDLAQLKPRMESLIDSIDPSLKKSTDILTYKMSLIESRIGADLQYSTSITEWHQYVCQQLHWKLLIFLFLWPSCPHGCSLRQQYWQRNIYQVTA